VSERTENVAEKAVNVVIGRKKQQKTRIKTKSVAERSANVVIGRKKATKNKNKDKKCC